MIYFFDNIECFTDELFWRSLRVMPQHRVQKAASFKNMRDKKLSAIAYLLLVHGLKKEYGIDEEIFFLYSKNGKPYLKNYPEIFFNISHCQCGVVCAIAEEEVGIDIETVTNYDEAVVKYSCNSEEYNSIVSSNNQSFAFCKLWTVKESVLKYTGEGLCDDLKNVLNNIHLHIETVWSDDCRYVISVCKRK